MVKYKLGNAGWEEGKLQFRNGYKIFRILETKQQVYLVRIFYGFKEMVVWSGVNEQKTQIPFCRNASTAYR